MMKMVVVVGDYDGGGDGVWKAGSLIDIKLPKMSRRLH